MLKGYVQVRMGRNQRIRVDGVKKKQKKMVKTGIGMEVERDNKDVDGICGKKSVRVIQGEQWR